MFPQILFWLLGLLMIWWLAFKIGFGRNSSTGLKRFKYLEVEERQTPGWMESALNRVRGSSLTTTPNFQPNRIELAKKMSTSDEAKNF